ncbi:acyl CoA binding protein-domain-containing protein [Sphaerosporella brunnea]|uniref:Acyl CoA binding protein-domain-containing protein n=1 Tax=Sphaerosporella brunnea TaxID=1250544 RepID=A0A5J5ELA2_9PEZI|nr:acyl CoA binding protein-domain-containing protein [Sphaerosporella brunnea]
MPENPGSQQFQDAVAIVRKLKVAPDYAEMLKLYAHFKQVTVGDLPAGADKPAFYNMTERRKFEAREPIRGMSAKDAEKIYIKFVDELIEKYGLEPEAQEEYEAKKKAAQAGEV